MADFRLPVHQISATVNGRTYRSDGRGMFVVTDASDIAEFQKLGAIREGGMESVPEWADSTGTSLVGPDGTAVEFVKPLAIRNGWVSPFDLSGTDDERLQAAADAAVAAGLPMILVPGRTLSVSGSLPLVLTAAHNGLRIICPEPSSVPNIKTVAGSYAAQWIVVVDPAPNTETEDILIEGVWVDGNYSNVTFSSSHHGFVMNGYRSGGGATTTQGRAKGITLRRCVASNFKSSGFMQLSQFGESRRLSCEARDNGEHGFGISAGSLYEESCVSSGNGRSSAGYGFDWSGGDTTSVNPQSKNNVGSGGCKISVATDYLGAELASSLHLVNADILSNAGPGFTDTTTAGQPFRLMITDGRSTLNGAQNWRFTTDDIFLAGSIYSDSGYQIDTPATEDGDVLIKSERIRGPGTFVVSNAAANGMAVEGPMSGELCAHVTGAQRKGIYVYGTGALLKLRAALVGNNVGGNSAADGAALAIMATTSVVDVEATFDDPAGTPTQISNLRVTGGNKVNVTNTVFDADIATIGDRCLTANAGTEVTFGVGVSNLVMRAKGTLTANGNDSTTAFSATFATAISGLGGLAYRAKITPRSSASSAAHWVSAISTTAVTVTYAAAPVTGTGNVVYDYEVEAYISR